MSALRHRLADIADNTNDFLERHFWRSALVFVGLFFVWSVVRDARAPLWADEIRTLYTARLVGPPEIVRSILDCSDAMPPLYPVLAHALLRILPSEALAIRLPATLGYCAMIVFLLWFCRRRMPAAYAWIAVLLACNATLYYATEGRPYGVVLGCAAGALFCWQTAAEGRHRTTAVGLLALNLALMAAMHYYSIFILVPLFLAEMAHWRISGRASAAVPLASIPAFLVLAAHYPFMVAAKPLFGYNHAPGWASILEFYNQYCSRLLLWFIVPVTALAVFPDITGRGHRNWKSFTQPERVAAGVLALMPVFAVIVSTYTTRSFVSRYALWALLGCAVAGAAVLCSAARAHVTAGLSMILALLVMLVGHEAYWAAGWPQLREGEAIRRQLASLRNTTDAIFVSNHRVFLELSYYADPPVRERLLDPLSRELDVRYAGTDLDAVLMTGLSRHSRLQIVNYETALSRHAQFILAAIPGDYLPWHLITAGYDVTPFRPGTSPALYLVKAPPERDTRTLPLNPPDRQGSP